MCIIESSAIAKTRNHLNSQQRFELVNYDTVTQNISFRKAACVQKNRYYMPSNNIS